MNSTIDLSEDRVFVRRALEGLRGGATAIYEKYMMQVRALIGRFCRDPHQAEDLAQEAFCFAFRRLERLRDVRSIRSWLKSITWRVLLLGRRSASRRVTEVCVDDQATLGRFPAGDETSRPDRCAVAAHVRQLVDELPSPFKETLVQRFYQDLPVARIAKAQQIDEPLAKYRIRRGVRLLARRLEVHGMDAGLFDDVL